ncbi:MAG: hypothetical protein SAqTSB_33540 [Shewanella algae]
MFIRAYLRASTSENDILLVENIERLTRLKDWKTLIQGIE